MTKVLDQKSNSLVIPGSYIALDEATDNHRVKSLLGRIGVKCFNYIPRKPSPNCILIDTAVCLVGEQGLPYTLLQYPHFEGSRKPPPEVVEFCLNELKHFYKGKKFVVIMDAYFDTADV